MDDIAFDEALVAAAFNQAALTGWARLSVVEAARAAGLPLDRARRRFPGPVAVLARFGVIADAAALAQPATQASPRERLFDLLMQRFDVLQHHREGMVALLDGLPANPLLALGLGAATLRSMGWMLEAAGLSASGARGVARAHAMVGVWLYTLRAWKRDLSADMAGTMAALDKALGQADRLFPFEAAEPEAAADDPMAGVVDVPAEEPDGLVRANPPPPPDVPPPASPI